MIKPKKPSRREQILQASLRLFNEQGVHAVSAHDIARDLDISPGNLTYHFKKKNNIVDSLADLVEDALTQSLGQAGQLNATAVVQAEATLQVLGVFWHYRFFFNNLGYVASKDEAQTQRYLHMRDMTIDMVKRAMLDLAFTGAAQPLDSEHDRHMVSSNLWYLWLSHLRMYMIETPSAEQTEKAYYRFAAEHMYAYLEPYYSETVREGFLQNIDMLLEKRFGK